MEEIRFIRDHKAIRIATESTRRKILSLLRVRGMVVSQLAELLEKDQSTVYRHVEKLQEAGLIVPSGERKTHHIPERIYTRTARIFLIAPDTSTTIDEVELSRFYGREEVTRMLRVLKSLGYLDELTPDLVQEARDLLLYIDNSIREELERVTLEEEMELHTIWRLEMLLLLVKARRDEVFEGKLNDFLDRLRSYSPTS
ncbi:MAG: helix-turn-helix domain-containing protein [Candidatus Thermoplasmatota archaeon]|nr:helix-turn-helix domain-containing protein [Candidatus Thermoplasmatota archaeon]